MRPSTVFRFLGKQTVWKGAAIFLLLFVVGWMGCSMQPSNSFLDRSAVIEFVSEAGTPIAAADIASRRLLKSQLHSNGGSAVFPEKIQGLLIPDNKSGLLSLNEGFLQAFDLWVEDQDVVEVRFWINGRSGAEIGIPEEPLPTEEIRKTIINLAQSPTSSNGLTEYLFDILGF